VGKRAADEAPPAVGGAVRDGGSQVRNRHYWRDPEYWRWRWHTIGRDARALLAVVAALAFGVVGYLMASGLSTDASAGPGTAYETTLMRTLTATRDGRTITQLVPDVRTVRVRSAETYFDTTTEAFLRTMTTPGGTRVVTDSVTRTVPVIRRVVVTGPGRTRTQVETQSQTVTNEQTNVETRTATETVTRTQTVSGPPVTHTETETRTQTATETETVTVTQPPVTQTTTVTEPAVTVTVTISVPELP